MTTAPKRFLEIDLLRFIAAFSVMLYHYTYRGWAQGDQLSDLVFPTLGPIFRYGYLGVDIFFIISGFVILMSVQGRSPADFIVSRVVRLYPAFWACVSLTAVCIWFLSDGRFDVHLSQYLINLTMLHSFAGIPHVDGVYWSLIVELKFYLLIFGLLMFGQMFRTELFLWIWLFCAVLIKAFNLAGVVSFFLIPDWAPYFISGACFYLISSRGWSLNRLLLLFTAYLAIMINLSQFWDSSESASSYIPQVALTIFFVIFLGIVEGWFSRYVRSWYVQIGALTYPLYLLHQNVGFILFNSFSNFANKWLILLAVTSLVFLVCWLVAKYVEGIGGRYLRQVMKSATGILPSSFHVKNASSN